MMNDTTGSADNKSSRIPLILFLLAVPFLFWAWYRYPGSLTFAGIFWSTVLVVAGSAFLFNKRKKVEDAPMRQKIQGLQQQGIALYYETEAPLDVKDVAKLLKAIRTMYLAIVILGGIGWAIVYFLIEGGILAYSIFSLLMLLILFGAVRGRRDYMQIAKEDKKIIFRGLITDRIKKEEGSGDDKRYTYFLRIGERELEVEEKFYDRYPVGQAAEIHFALAKNGSPFIFKDEVIPVSNVATSQA